MYLKLAFRNAKRSIWDYLLYILTMTALISILCISNCFAKWGEMAAGFQTISLPLLIVVIMVVLANYINTFIVRQRAKEFATYMLMGMDKDKLSLMFLCELSIIGLICFLLGVLLGLGIYLVYFYMLLHESGGLSILVIVMKSIVRSFGYFCLTEILCIFFMKNRIYKLQIIQLMHEKRRNQPFGVNRRSLWGWMCIVNLLVFLVLLFGVLFMTDKVMSVAVSVIAIPMLLCVLAFYKWLYAYTASLRLSRASALYQGNRLYEIAEITKSGRRSAGINTIFSICLIFSAASFVVGSLFNNSDIIIFEWTKQKWMGFMQIGICIIFMVIYFFMLSLSQIIDLRREKANVRLLLYIGKSWAELKRLICTQIIVKLLLPVFMSMVMLGIAVPFVNYKLNSLLPESVHNLLLRASGTFAVSFMGLYGCYFVVVYLVSARYIRISPKVSKGKEVFNC